MAQQLMQGIDTQKMVKQILPQIFDEVKKLPLWVCYKLQWNEKKQKYSKIPKNPRSGYGAKANDSSTWSTYNEAIEAIQRYNLDGVGLEFDCGYLGIDLDNVIDEQGNLSAAAAEIVQMMDSYTEYSPSGKGLHILCKAAEAKEIGTRNDSIGLEMYNHGRFFTVTGNVYGELKPIQERTEQAKAVYMKYLYQPPKQKQQPNNQTVITQRNIPQDDGELWLQMFNSSKGRYIEALYRGDISAYNDNHSGADQALCNYLAWWTNLDENRIDRMFRQTALYRPKWDEIHDGKHTTYGQMTIREAISKTTVEYNSPISSQRQQEQKTDITLKSAADFEDFEQSWIWYPYIPEGEITALFSGGGSGKTFLCCGIAADLSNGTLLPNEGIYSTERTEPQKTLIITGEDRGGLLKGRLEKANANLNNVYIFDCEQSEGLKLTDEEFEELVSNSQAKLVIIDPWHAFLGDIDLNRTNIVRPVLHHIANVAKRCKCGIVLISHNNKKAQAQNANNAALGSADYINAARSALQIVTDEDDRSNKTLVHTKANYSGEGKSVKYRITPDGGFEWDGFSEMTKATMESAARYNTTAAALQAARDDTHKELYTAICDLAKPEEEVNISYQELREKYGSDVFGYAKRETSVLKQVEKMCNQDRITLIYPKRVKYKGNSLSGFAIYKSKI